MTELKNITHNVHEGCGLKVERVQGDIDRDIYDYLFNHVIAFTHGSRQAMINFFFQRLFEACQEAGINKVWDESNGEKLTEILNRLNFDKTIVIEVAKKTRKHESRRNK